MNFTCAKKLRNPKKKLETKDLLGVRPNAKNHCESLNVFTDDINPFKCLIKNDCLAT